MMIQWIDASTIESVVIGNKMFQFHQYDNYLDRYTRIFAYEVAERDPQGMWDMYKTPVTRHDIMTEIK